MTGVTNNEFMGRLNAALKGRYRIERELGQGGMATVFLAEDLRHEREVALKVLKPELAAVVGAERFLAEIKTTANLQHPHILPLFDSGEADGFLFYVMPFVQGESLREKLDREKQLPVDEATEIAAKVAGALHYAHGQGVVHRDIKPANILISRDQPLVADFGIALALSEAGGGRITETGLSLGTPHYMSPEQAAGDQSLDKRSDVYALGCVVYEMLAGEPPYGGPTAQSVLAKILTGDLRPLTELRRSVPAHVDAAVAKALQKLPADRFASAETFARALSDPGFRYGGAGSTAGRAGGRVEDSGNVRRKAAIAAAAILAGALGLTLGLVLRPDSSAAPALMTAMDFPEEQRLMDVPFGPTLDLSSDGSMLVYVGPASAGTWQLWVRRADQLDATPLPGSEGVISPRFSPEGDAVAFVTRDQLLRTVDIRSGTTRTLAENVGIVTAWGADGNLYHIGGVSPGINRVAATGGEPERVPGMNPAADNITPPWTWGDVLPDGEHGVWTRLPEGGGAEGQVIAVVNMETGESRELAPGSSPRYLHSGHLAWLALDGTLLVAEFDAGARELTGPAIPIAQGVRTDLSGAAHAAFSQTGDLIYRSGAARSDGLSLIWVDREGNPTYIDQDWQMAPSTAGDWSGVDLSPDGTRLVTMDARGGSHQLWVKNLEDGTPPSRITFEGDFHVRPRWTPDGESVTFISNLGGEEEPTQVWTRAADGRGSPRQLLSSDVEIEEALLGPDGEWLVYRQGGTTADRDIYALRPGADTVGRPLIATAMDEKSPDLSPDGRWLAYVSDETGQPEVFVRPFPEVTGGKWQVSVGGGLGPRWANSGRELFYMDSQARFTSARLDLRESSLAVTAREPLFGLSDHYIDQNYAAYDVGSDDQRFLMLSYGSSSDEGRVVWVRNWLSEWSRRAGQSERGAARLGPLRVGL